MVSHIPMLEKCRSTEKPLQVDVPGVLYFWRYFVVLGLKVGNSEQICRNKRCFERLSTIVEAAWGNSKQGLSRKYTEFCSVHTSLSRQQQKTVWSSVVIEQETREHRPMRFRLRVELRCLRKTFLQECRDTVPRAINIWRPRLDSETCWIFFPLSHQMASTQLAKMVPQMTPSPPFLSLGTEVRGTKTNFQHFPINALPWPLSWRTQSSFFYTVLSRSLLCAILLVLQPFSPLWGYVSSLPGMTSISSLPIQGHHHPHGLPLALWAQFSKLPFSFPGSPRVQDPNF